MHCSALSLSLSQRWGSFEKHTFMTLFAHTFNGVTLSCNSCSLQVRRFEERGDNSHTNLGSSSLTLLLLLVLGGFKTKTTSWAHFRDDVHDRGQEVKTSLDLWCGAAAAAAVQHITHYRDDDTQLWLLASSGFIAVVQVSINSLFSTALVFPLLPPRPMKIGTIFRFSFSLRGSSRSVVSFQITLP